MRKVWWLAAISAVLALAAGCHNSGHSQNSTDMRTINAIAGGGAIDVLVDSDVKTSGLAYGATSPFSEFDSGSREVVLRATSSQAIYYDKTISLGSGANTTLIAYGTPASVQALPLDDSSTSPSSSADFKIRVVDASSDAAAVDAYVTQATDITNTAPTFSSALLGVATAYAESPAGNYQLVFTLAGTKDILFQAAAPQNLSAGVSYTLVMVASGGGKLANAVLYAQGSGGAATYLANPNGRLKAVNAVPDSTVLTYKADGATLLSSVPFGGTSSYVPLTSGTRNLTLEASNVPGVTIASLAQQVASARDYTAIAVNNLAQVQLIAFTDDNTLPGAGLAKIRYVNAQVGSTAVDVLLNFAGQVSGLAYASASSYYQVTPSTTYTISFATPGGVTVIATAYPVELDAGAVYTAYLIGTATAAQIRLVRDR
ncbi:MAG TPA: DUF4397 domain-containing protein [Usitatibacter sp.]|nr:DUF4397 domain-containing protein [Usitatibacter sp.]